MCQWLMAKYYDRIMHDAEEKGLGEWRGALLKTLQGDVLELGAGTGANLAFYPDNLNHLYLLEPSVHMRKHLKTRLENYAGLPLEILSDNAETISLADASVDAVVSTLVLCSVTNLDKALSEIYRVLKPGGHFYFIEHVAATNNPNRYKWQRRLDFIWKYLASGCRVTRDTETAIKRAGFQIESIERQSIRGVPPIVRPSIRGIAVKCA